MARRVSETMYFVRDLDAAIEFYTVRMGCELTEKHEWGFAVVELPGGQRLGLCQVQEFEPTWKPGDPMPAPRVAIQTTDIEADHMLMTRAGVQSTEPKGDPGAIRYLSITDPDGNLIFLWDDGSGKFGG